MPSENNLNALPSWVRPALSLGTPTFALVWIIIEVRSAAVWFGNNVAMPVTRQHIATLEELTDSYKRLSGHNESMTASQLRTEATLVDLQRSLQELNARCK